jgi:hypothetical protein
LGARLTLCIACSTLEDIWTHRGESSPPGVASISIRSVSWKGIKPHQRHRMRHRMTSPPWAPTCEDGPVLDCGEWHDSGPNKPRLKLSLVDRLRIRSFGSVESSRGRATNRGEEATAC